MLLSNLITFIIIVHGQLEKLYSKKTFRRIKKEEILRYKLENERTNNSNVPLKNLNNCCLIELYIRHETTRVM